MGTASEGSEGGGISDVLGVGTIVWVLRRNGSWWPGRVLGMEELADSHLMSPRSGTPVKLLGRDDASVDWYNLEKSKRVKPFRCGEFDACIERAEASQGIPFKKREKYARREDAILHALELEKQQIDLKQQNTAFSCLASSKILDVLERDSSHHFTEVPVLSKVENQKFLSSSRKVPTSLDEHYLDHSLDINKNRKYKQSISGEDEHVIVNHLKEEDVGCQDGVGKEKLHCSDLGGSSNLTSEEHPDFLAHSRHSWESVSQADIGKKFSILKRKTFSSSTSDTPKRRDTVLQSSAKSPVSHFVEPNHDGILNPATEDDRIGIIKDVKRSTFMIPSPEANGTLDYCRNSSKHGPSDIVSDDQQPQPGCTSSESIPSGWTVENDFDSSATDSELELDERKYGVVTTHPYKQTAENSESGGKRNPQDVAMRPHSSMDGNNFDVTYSPPEVKESGYHIGEFEPLIMNAHAKEFSCKNELSYDAEEDELFVEQENNNFDIYHSGFVHSNEDYQLMPQSGLGTVSSSFRIQKAHWEDPEYFINQLYASTLIRRMMPMLVDVDLKVQAKYPRERVPLISLMSKLNGRAIVGHPVHIEILDDGSSELLVPTNEATLDENTSPPHIWRTAKRTSMHRLPRSKPDPLISLYHERKPDFELMVPPVKKRKSTYHADQFASGEFHRKPFKPLSLSSSQKTRTFSSFTSDEKLDKGSDIFRGLIKPEGEMPLVSCIPMKVVFSRILEAVGGPSSAPPTHHSIAARVAERDAS